MPESMEDEDVPLLLRAIQEKDTTKFLRYYKKEYSKYKSKCNENLAHLAAAYGALSILEIIKDDVYLYEMDSSGNIPLIIAANRGHTDICEWIIEQSDNNVDWERVLQSSIDNGHQFMCSLIVFKYRNVGQKVLGRAIRRNALPTVKLLLAAGASCGLLDKIDGEKWVPIHDAIKTPEIVRELLRYGVGVDAPDLQGQTALSKAAALGEVSVCKILLESGASVNSIDQEGRSPLYHAAINVHEDTLSLILAHGGSINSANNDNRTALFELAEKGNSRACALLLKYGADPNYVDKSGYTPLHIAASYGYKDICRLFLEALSYGSQAYLDPVHAVFCKPNSLALCWTSVDKGTLYRIYAEILEKGARQTMTKYGTLLLRDLAMNTLLHIAASDSGNADSNYIIRVLHHVGRIPINIRNCYEQTPLQAAMESQPHTVAQSLLHSLVHSGSADSYSNQRTTKPILAFHSRKSSNIRPNCAHEFTVCSRHRLEQLFQGIQKGLYRCYDEIVAQVDQDRGDTVLHLLFESYARCENTFLPTVAEQRSILESNVWLGEMNLHPHLSSYISKRNWEGQTALHAAARIGALGFVQALLERGASLEEECIAPDCTERFLYTGTCEDLQLFVGCSLSEDIQLWNALNFACCTFEREIPSEQRKTLVKYLLEIPDAIPRDPRALEDCRRSINTNFPTLLPFYLRVADESINRDVYEEAEALSRQFMRICYDTAENQPRDISSVKVHKVLIDIEQRGLDVLTRHETLHCVIESTGDTLLHIIAAHGFPREYPQVIRYLIGVGGLNVNIQNKQMKTPLHLACEHSQSEICRLLLSFGAKIGVSCFSPCIEFPWKTPLYLILGCTCNPLKHKSLPTSTLQFSIAEILLKTPGSIAIPQHPKQLKHSSTSTSSIGSTYLDDVVWNQWVLERVLDRFPSLLPAYLDHFYSEMRTTNGEKTFRFQEVKEVCKNLELILGLEWERKRRMHQQKKWNSSVVTHLVIRNAIDVKWKLYGLRYHRWQLSLYICTLVFFFLSNLFLSDKSKNNLEVSMNLAPAANSTTEQRDWIPIFTLIMKILCWVMAFCHLVYVELFLEWRSEGSQYWRSVWNLLDIGTFILILVTIPFELIDGYDTLRECLLSLASILLCVNLMQALLVSSFFSVLIFTFARMCKVVTQFLSLYVLLLLGFSGGFHILFHGLGPHSSFFSTARIVFLATFGEINYDQNFNFDSKARNLLGFAILVVYILVVVIVALNLLVALMTSEYETVRSKAEERSLIELAKVLHHYEKWIGKDVVEKLFESDLGLFLIHRTTEIFSLTKFNEDQEMLHGRLKFEPGDPKCGPNNELLATEVSKCVQQEVATIKHELISQLDELKATLISIKNDQLDARMRRPSTMTPTGTASG